MLLFALSVSTLLPMAATLAHEVRPAYLRITQRDVHRYEVLWKQPATGEFAVRLSPRLSSGWLDAEPATVQVTPGFLIKVWRITPASDAVLDGQTLTIEGLERTITDVLVDVALADGSEFGQILKPQQPMMELDLQRVSSKAVPAYFALGVEHILTGIDHLLFVFGLILLVQNRWQLLKTITAFTVAHSITLAATALGWVRLQSAVVEALVALSIVFLALELVRACRQQRQTLATRLPWAIALIFGLLHGFAFAGAIAEIGLPPHDIAWSLLLFNVGVEIGQLIFVVVVLALIALLQRLPRQSPAKTRWIAPYAIGSFAAFWFLQRIAFVI